MLSAVTVQGSVPARADDDDTPSSWSIPNYDLKAQVDKNGDAKVTLEMTFDFAEDQGHGPYVTFATRQRLTDDPDHWRMIDYSDVTASSPSGADATVETKNESGAMLLRIDLLDDGLLERRRGFLGRRVRGSGLVSAAHRQHPPSCHRSAGSPRPPRG